MLKKQVLIKSKGRGGSTTKHKNLVVRIRVGYAGDKAKKYTQRELERLPTSTLRKIYSETRASYQPKEEPDFLPPPPPIPLEARRKKIIIVWILKYQ